LYDLLFVEDKIIHPFYPQKEKSKLGAPPIKILPSKSPNQAGICRRLPRLRLDSCDDVNVGKSSEAGPSSSTSSQSSYNSKVTTNSKSTKKGGRTRNKNWIFGPEGTKIKRGKSMGNLDSRDKSYEV
jgi:hypothetical protein